MRLSVTSVEANDISEDATTYLCTSICIKEYKNKGRRTFGLRHDRGENIFNQMPNPER